MNCLVTDVDNTIADTRDRLRRSLKEIDREEVFDRTADRYGGFGDYLDEKEEEKFWKVFLSNRFLHLDGPAPGAADILCKLTNRSVDLVYLTGRHDEEGDSMRPGTESWLRKHGFPSPDQEGVDLYMKPRRNMDDREFKLAKLNEEFLEEPTSGEVIGVGDHPNDALVYKKVGIEPVLIDWLGLFPRKELKNSTNGVMIVKNWKGLEKDLDWLRNRTQ